MGQLEAELSVFEGNLTQTRFKGLTVTRLYESAYLLKPAKSLPLPAGKTIGLTLSAIVHGNEVAGLAVLNDFLGFLRAHEDTLTFPLALFLGNTAAARAGKRFLDRDLNRSFDRTESATREDKRARELETQLAATAFYLDLHQTTEPSEKPFFIFPYTESSYRFARDVNPRLPIVTHWGEPFSADGRCTDEYVNSQGGVGITVELGQNGFLPQMVASGLHCVLGALTTVKARLAGEKAVEAGTLAPEIYTWAEVLPYPTDKDFALDPGWINFKEVTRGQRLGAAGSKVVKASVGGRILFPKYVRDPQAAPPKELCRILKQVGEQELGKDDAR